MRALRGGTPPTTARADAPAPDPFPREHLAALAHRLPAYARLAWNLGRDPVLSKARRGAVVAAAGYLVSPLDLIPGIIPVLGQLDDLLVLLAALRYALAGLDPQQRAARLSAVGLTDADLAEDLRTLGLTTAWLARSGGRTAVRAGRAGLRTGGALARAVVPKALRGVQRSGQAVARRIRRSAASSPQPGMTGSGTGSSLTDDAAPG